MFHPKKFFPIKSEKDNKLLYTNCIKIAFQKILFIFLEDFLKKFFFFLNKTISSSFV